MFTLFSMAECQAHSISEPPKNVAYSLHRFSGMLVYKVGVAHHGSVPPMPEQPSDQGQILARMTLCFAMSLSFALLKTSQRADHVKEELQ